MLRDRLNYVCNSSKYLDSAKTVCVEGQWRSRYNDELYEMYGLTVVQRIKLARLRWAGHVVRMETHVPARKVFLGRPQGQRRRGRPKLRWQDGVEESTINPG